MRIARPETCGRHTLENRGLRLMKYTHTVRSEAPTWTIQYLDDDFPKVEASFSMVLVATGLGGFELSWDDFSRKVLAIQQ